MDLMEFIKPELLVLVPVLSVVGEGLKRSRVSDEKIPLVLGAVSCLLSLAYVGATADVTAGQSVLMGGFTALTQGVLCAGVSVYANQVLKQGKK